MKERDRETEKWREWREKDWSLNRLVDMKNSRNALPHPTAQVLFSSSVLTSRTPCRSCLSGLLPPHACDLYPCQWFAGACRSEGHSTDMPLPRDLCGALFPPAAPSPPILPCSRFLWYFPGSPRSLHSSFFPVTIIQHSEQKQPGEEKVYSTYTSK